MLSQSAKHEVRGVASCEMKDFELNILNSTYTAVWMKILVT